MNMNTVEYSSIKVGDMIWNKDGYSGRRGHWTRVISTERDGDAVILSVSDGYKQYGNAREGVVVRKAT